MKERGVTMVMLALLVGTVLLPFVGLAIDGAILYIVRTKLSSSVDAAALAAARSLSLGSNVDAQAASAASTAASFFQANFPDGWFNTSNATVTTSVAQDSSAIRRVTVQASAKSPLYFMQILGIPATVVGATGQASRRDVNLMLVLDRSSSMSGSPCTQMKAAAVYFTGLFAEQHDVMGLLTFMGGYRVDFPPSSTFQTGITTQLNSLQCGGNTGTAQALYQAWQQIRTVNEPGALNVIVLFTDGLPNGISVGAGGTGNGFLTLLNHADSRFEWQNTGTSTTVPANSSCLSAPLASPALGFIAQQSNSQPTGTTAGLRRGQTTSISDTSEPDVSPAGCASASDDRKLRLDFAFIPATDINGYPTTGGYKTPDPIIDLYPSGSPYAGNLRIDRPSTMSLASANAAYNVAQDIKHDSTYHPVIFALGLGGTGLEPADKVFLQLIASDSGKYIWAPGPGDLKNAYTKIAAQVLRLAM